MSQKTKNLNKPRSYIEITAVFINELQELDLMFLDLDCSRWMDYRSKDGLQD